MAKWQLTPDGNAFDPSTGQLEDPVNNPSHYKSGNIESIEYIQSFLSKEEYQGFLRGNISKYLHRMDYKGKPLEDLKKAKWYLERLIELKETK
jgi:Protein of unknwon function (DUF3310)